MAAVGIEAQGLLLVVDVDAGEFDPHGFLLCLIRGASPLGLPYTLTRYRSFADAPSAASRFLSLLAVLDPDLVVRADMAAGAPTEIRGAAIWAKGAVAYGHLTRLTRPALVDGASASWWRRRDDW